MTERDNLPLYGIAWRCWIDPAWFDSEAFRSEQDVVNAAHV
jgi:hypothetical protein